MTDTKREAFEKHFTAAAANWLPRSNQYSGPYDLLWKGWCAALESAGALTDERIDAIAEESDWPKSMLAPVILQKLRQFARAILRAALTSASPPEPLAVVVDLNERNHVGAHWWADYNEQSHAGLTLYHVTGASPIAPRPDHD